MESYALVLWKDTQETSVLPVNDVKGEINEKEAKWGNKFYPVKVIVQSVDKKWLDSLRVSVNGELILEGDTPARSKELLTRRVADRKEQNDLKKIQAASKKTHEEATLKSSSIFDSVSRGNESPDKDKNRKSIGDKAKQSSDDKSKQKADDKISKQKADDKAKQKTNLKPKKKDGNKAKQKANEEMTEGVGSSKLCKLDNPAKVPEALQDTSKDCFCSKLPEVTSSDIDVLVKMLNLARSIFAGENVGEVSLSVDKTQPAMTGLSKNKIIPLFEGPLIRLPQWKIEGIVATHKKNAKGMVRKFMTEIVGKETLLKSSPTGKGGRTPIPTDVLEDVEMFVQKNVRKKFRLSHDEFIRCCTSQCATLRTAQKALDSGIVKEGKAANGTKVEKKEEAKQQKLTEMKDEATLKKHTNKIENGCKKNSQRNESKKRLEEEESDSQEEEEKQKSDDDSDDEAGTSDSNGSTSGDEETYETEQRLNGESQAKDDDIQLTDNSKGKNGIDSEKDQAVKLDRNERSIVDPVRKNQPHDLVSSDGEAAIMCESNLIGSTDFSNSSSGSNHENITSNRNVMSSSEHLTSTSSSASRESFQEKENEGDTRAAYSETPLPEIDNQERSSKTLHEGGGNSVEMKVPSDENQHDLHTEIFKTKETAYLTKIRELEAKLSKKSDEDSCRSKRSSEVKKRKKADSSQKKTKKLKQ